MDAQTPPEPPDSPPPDVDAAPPQEPSAKRDGWPLRVLRFAISSLLPLIVIALGAYGAMKLINSREKVPERPRASIATLVTIETASHVSTRVHVDAMGTVMAARETMLMPQVTGRIEKLSPDFQIGGLFKSGEELLRIERQDYELALEQRKGDLARAEYEVSVEKGFKIIAKSELEVTGLRAEDPSSHDLLLRKPHLKKVKASLEAAKAMVKDAQLDIERTTIRAPFNAVVARKDVDLGTLATPQARLCTLVGTDEYWVKVSLPVEQLAWIKLPRRAGEEGSTARVRQAGLAAADSRDGTVVRSLAEVETTGRMASVLVSVQDPLGLTGNRDPRTPLLIGAFVHVRIAGRELEDVFALPRHAIREGSRVWVMREDDTLDIREVKIVWRDRDRALIDNGLQVGERIVVGNIATPVQGMKLRVNAARSAGDAK